MSNARRKRPSGGADVADRGSGPRKATRHDYLADLATALDERRRMDEMISRLVAGAVKLGASWGDVGQVLGVTRQAARQRYGVRRGRVGA